MISFEFFSSKYHGEKGGEWGEGYTRTWKPKEISKIEFTWKLPKSHYDDDEVDNDWWWWLLMISDDDCWWWLLLMMIIVDDDCCWWWLLLMMIVVVDDVDDDDNDDDERKLQNWKLSSFQNFWSRIVFFLNVFDYSKTFFQNLVRRGVRGGEGWCRNMKAERKNSKLEIKVFFKVLKFLSLFSSISMVFSNFFSLKISWREMWGVGEGLYRNPIAQRNL